MIKNVLTSVLSSYVSPVSSKPSNILLSDHLEKEKKLETLFLANILVSLTNNRKAATPQGMECPNILCTIQAIASEAVQHRTWYFEVLNNEKNQVIP